MEIQETSPVATTRQMIHLQVAGEHTQEDLVNIISKFQETLQAGGVIATANNVVASVIQTTDDLAGMILTPKMTALEIASIVVDVIRDFDVSQGTEPSARFSDIEQDAKLEVMRRIQAVLRFGAFAPSEGSASEELTRDALFMSVVRSLGSKLSAPSLDNLISVTRIAQKEGDEDFDVNFKELVAGDIFKHGEGTFVAESNPYVNWVANPLPVVTIDAKVYQAPEPVAPEDIKATSKPSKKKVQSKPSNSTAKARKK